jgi:ribosome-associated toxin RatA of RatAB toxin-antitoxin module
VKRLEPDPVERVVSAAPADVYAVVEDVETYPEWMTGVQGVDVHERGPDGRVSVARIHMELPIPVVKGGFAFTGAVDRTPPSRVTLRRKPSREGDEQALTVDWRLEPEGSGTRVRLEMDATVDVPRFAPLGGPADSMARGFADALVERVGG